MAGTIVSDTLQDGAGNSTATTNAIKGSAKVWINFNGNSGGTAINASYNVSSLTRNTTGDYTIGFTSGFANTNYSLAGMSVGYASGNPAGVCVSLCGNSSYTAAPLGKNTGSVRVTTGQYNIATDSYDVSVVIFSN